MMTTTNPNFLNGVPELLLLQLLARKPMYGYELTNAISHMSGAVLDFGEGCIYPVLHRLEKDGLLTARRETVAGRSRIVYRVTAAGRKRLGARVVVWRRIVKAINQILLEENNGRPAIP
jgi:PadR family transcriptional regulator PadR